MNQTHLSRRELLKTSAIAGAATVTSSLFLSHADAKAYGQPTVRDIGSRRELFVDHFLIDALKGSRLKLHAPQRAEGALTFDKPWEGVYCGYTTLFRDDGLFRLYYLGYPVDPAGNYTCYAESKDGIHWTRPDLGLVEFQGTKQNNIILAGLPECHNFSPFLDTKPGTPNSERYKAIGGVPPRGLMAYVSPDGIHWKKMQGKGVITKGAFDSHNVAFYSESEEKYVCYFRTFRNGVRWIDRATSDDFLHWTEPVAMDFGEAPAEHLYTNSTTPYFRAPHLSIALPCRFMPGRDVVTQEMKQKLGVAEGYLPKGSGFTDMPLMTTRGGHKYDRTFMETFIPVGTGLKNWTSRANYPAFGIVPTPDSKTDLSIYVNRHTGYTSAHLARYTLRYDGFISVNAPFGGGEMTTRLFTFRGKNLSINYTTSAPGSIGIEIQDTNGEPLPGFTLSDCPTIVGDEIDRTVTWQSGANVGKLAGKPIRLRFAMRAADLYAIQFIE